MKRTAAIILFPFLVLLLFGKSFALTNEEATQILKDYIKTEFKILEIKEAPLEGFWEVACGIGQDRVILYIHKKLEIHYFRADIGSPNQEKPHSR